MLIFGGVLLFLRLGNPNYRPLMTSSGAGSVQYPGWGGTVDPKYEVEIYSQEFLKFCGLFFFYHKNLGGGNSIICYFYPIVGEMIQFDNYFQMGWLKPPTKIFFG